MCMCEGMCVTLCVFGCVGQRTLLGMYWYSPSTLFMAGPPVCHRTSCSRLAGLLLRTRSSVSAFHLTIGLHYHFGLLHRFRIHLTRLVRQAASTSTCRAGSLGCLLSFLNDSFKKSYHSKACEMLSQTSHGKRK